MRVVSPFRPFPAESVEHLALGAFDWLDAIRMMRASVTRSCRCDAVVITDADTTLPGPTFQYDTRERRLMHWILEVSLCYLAGPHFDRDTVMVSPDVLVFCDLREWMAGDVGIVVRPDHTERPILNSLQWWPVASRDKLLRLYTKALAYAKTLPEEIQVWGADSEPFRHLLRPLYPGCGPRKSGIVANLVDSRHVLLPLDSGTIAALEKGEAIQTPELAIDFRYLRKRYMRRFFDATIGQQVAA